MNIKKDHLLLLYCNITKIYRHRSLFCSVFHTTNFLCSRTTRHVFSSCYLSKGDHVTINNSSSINNSAQDIKTEAVNENYEFEECSPRADIDYYGITEGDPEKIKILKVLELEVEMMRQRGENVPETLKSSQWMNLLSLKSETKRLHYLNKLWITETRKKVKNENSKRYIALLTEKKKSEESNRNNKITTNSKVVYNLMNNSLFLRIYPSRMDRYYNYRLLKAMMFDLRILVDCGYESFMNDKNLSFCAKELRDMWAYNRIHDAPHHLIYCNMDASGQLMKYLRKALIGSHEPDFPVFHTSQDYLDLYPKEKLVYLTPKSKTELKYNPEDVYVVGGFVDKGNEKPIAYMKAKKENLRTASFPLDKYLNWGYGTKSLELRLVINILNDLKKTGKWEIALQNIPRNRLKGWNPVKKEDFSNADYSTSSSETIVKHREDLLYDLLLKKR